MRAEHRLTSPWKNMQYRQHRVNFGRGLSRRGVVVFTDLAKRATELERTDPDE